MLNEPALRDYLRGRVPGIRGPLAVERLRGGQSNPTFKLRDDVRSNASININAGSVGNRRHRKILRLNW